MSVSHQLLCFLYFIFVYGEWISCPSRVPISVSSTLPFSFPLLFPVYLPRFRIFLLKHSLFYYFSFCQLATPSVHIARPTRAVPQLHAWTAIQGSLLIIGCFWILELPSVQVSYSNME